VTPKAAKQFLISRIIEEAASEQIALSEIERKMLQFSEQYDPMPDMYEVNQEFERNYAADEYESKIANLLKNARSSDEQASSTAADSWRDALGALAHEDHYILVMVAQAFGSGWATGKTTNRTRELFIYAAIAIVIVFLIVLRSFHK